jgi:hypothetical protein
MTSKALDLTTIGQALNELCDAFLGDSEWHGWSDGQQEFLTWYAAHRDQIYKLDSLEALASIDYAELNRFLTAHGFVPMFESFSGIGVVSILDMLVEWMTEGAPTTIRREGVTYPAFSIDSSGAAVYEIAGYEDPLIRLATKTGHGLWLMKADEPASGLELNKTAGELLAAVPSSYPDLEWTAGVIVPMLEMDVQPDLSWLLGVTAISPDRKYVVQQAFQRFKLRANDKGARVKVATGIVMASASCGPTPKPYRLDDPFIGFFTQPGNDALPLAVFWADTDVWKNPGGTLEEL